MKRREFVRNSSIAVAFPLLASTNSCHPSTIKQGAENQEILQKVRNNLLAIQRFSWEQGVASHPFIDMEDVEMILAFARASILRQSEDGRPAMMGGHGVTDPVSAGEVILKAFQITGLDIYRNGLERALNYIKKVAPRTATGTLCHLDNRNEIWIDSMYMAPPFLAAAGEYREAFRQIRGFREVLFDPSTGLYKHIYSDERKEMVRDLIWGGGVGWTAAGIARTLTRLPDSMDEEKSTLVKWHRELLLALFNFQRPDGLFHDIVDDPSSYIETNLSQMTAYSIYTGLKHGWLDESYRGKAEELRNAAWSKIDKDGWVQDAAGAPRFDAPGISAEAQAFTMLMETAREGLRIKVQGSRIKVQSSSLPSESAAGGEGGVQGVRLL